VVGFFVLASLALLIEGVTGRALCIQQNSALVQSIQCLFNGSGFDLQPLYAMCIWNARCKWGMSARSIALFGFIESFCMSGPKDRQVGGDCSVFQNGDYGRLTKSKPERQVDAHIENPWKTTAGSGELFSLGGRLRSREVGTENRR
jgi:hypothetical protein